jgi:hypothetical protein
MFTPAQPARATAELENPNQRKVAANIIWKNRNVQSQSVAAFRAKWLIPKPVGVHGGAGEGFRR